MNTLDVTDYRGRAGLAVTGLLAAIIVASCGGAATTPGRNPHPTQVATASAEVAPSPTASATALQTAPPSATASATAPQTAPPSVSPTAMPRATSRPDGLARDSLAVTIANRIVVRSRPRIANDSTMYLPSLPTGTELYVMGGPVYASGYRWYDVAPLTVGLDGGVKHGWIAAAARDGTPWVAPLGGPPAPSGVTFVQKLDEADEPALVRAMQTVTWLEPRTAGVEIRVYGVVKCVAEPARRKPDTRGPCVQEHTPLPASVLTLVGSAPASQGVVSWGWVGVSDCGGGLESPPDAPPYVAVVVAAYAGSGRSTFAIATPGEWYEPPAGTVVC